MTAGTEFLSTPRADLDWNNLGLGNVPVNGHIESRYSALTGEWTKPKLVQDPELRIHGLSPALNYGQQAYEGLKAYRHSNGQIHLFRLQDHGQRLASSCSYVSIPSPSPDHFAACVLAAVAANAEFVPPADSTGGAALYVRPLIFGLSGHLPLTPPQEFLFCVYVRPAGAYLGGPGPLDAVVVDAFDRAAPRGTGAAKIGGNYAPVMPWTERAHRDGFALTLHLNSAARDYVDEFSSCGFVGLAPRSDGGSGYRMILPESNSAVKSVTSDSCAQLAKTEGWEVEKRMLSYSDLASLDEVLAVGTAVAIASVGSITRQSTADKFVYSKDSKPGNGCLTLLHKLRAIQEGRAIDKFGWLTQVEKNALDVVL